jgi:hypothetical protein
MAPVDTTNWQLVCKNGIGEVIIQRPRKRMTDVQALVHAAHLVLIADPTGDAFPEVLAKVQSA